MTSPALIEAHTLAMARQIVKAHYPEMPADYSGRRVQIVLAAIAETTNAARTLALAWRDDNRAEVADGDTSPAAYQIRGGGIEMNAFAGALKRGDHLKGGQ